MSAPSVGVVVVAYGNSPWLEQVAQEILASEGVALDVVVVDNGCTSAGVMDRLKSTPGVTVITPGGNTGFTGGCAAGAAASTGDYLAFINPDAHVASDAIRKLVDVAGEPGVGLATASVRLFDDPGTINTAGNPMHFLGFSWVGGHGDPVSAHATRTTVTGTSGCAFVIRRTLWDSLGGFADRYFAYHEDAELSVRCTLRGLTIDYVPDAVVLHHYEFSRNQGKFHYLERNRLAMITALYQTRTLVLLAPLLIITEAGVLIGAILGGWGRHKLTSWIWLLRNGHWVAQRRRLMQGERTVSDAQLVTAFADRFEPGNIEGGAALAVFNLIATPYWRLIKRFLPTTAPSIDRPVT